MADMKCAELSDSELNLNYAELIDGDHHLYAIHINQTDQDAKTVRDIQEKALGIKKDKEPHDFVCMWWDNKSRDADGPVAFREMQEKDYVVFKETGRDKEDKTHIGRVIDDKETPDNSLLPNKETPAYYKHVEWIKHFDSRDLKDGRLDRLDNALNGGNSIWTCKKIDECKEEVFMFLNKGIPDIGYYERIVRNSQNVIFRGAPGTGKTYLAKDIATKILFKKDHYEDLTDDEEKTFDHRCRFVQFHPSYDYTDFVEGLRPHTAEVKDEEDNIIRKDISFELEPGVFKKFCDDVKDDPNNEYVFIIDEINRGEISKIFGELFFSIEPEYRGEKGKVSTQYSNMHEDGGKEKFYIPKKVYIIGTMNDIDRSVDTFDFAMRRRFRFVEIKYDDTHKVILKDVNKEYKAIERMKTLNKVIKGEETLGDNYCIGAAYFKKLEDDECDVNCLWRDYIKPLLEEYVRGMGSREKTLMNEFKKAYYLETPNGTSKDEEVNE